MFEINKIFEDIRKNINEENILLNEPMKKHTTFKIGGNADIFVKVKDIQEIKYILEISKNNNIPLYIIGNGSNLLVNDNGIKGIVMQINLDNIQIQELNTSEFKVTVESGVKLAMLSRQLQKQGLSGFEFAAGIPGTIGGAIKMNAGAHNSEMKDIVLETTYIDYEGNLHTITNVEHNFEYRSSRFNNEKAIIISTTLLLKKGNPEEIKLKMDSYSKYRLENQPRGVFSAGSTFKRGTDFITAKLIDECGLKGYHINDAEVSTVHAGFIVNKGNATGKDVIKVIKHVKEKIYEKYKKNIELEIEII